MTNMKISPSIWPGWGKPCSSRWTRSRSQGPNDPVKVAPKQKVFISNIFFSMSFIFQIHENGINQKCPWFYNIRFVLCDSDDGALFHKQFYPMLRIGNKLRNRARLFLGKIILFLILDLSLSNVSQSTDGMMSSDISPQAQRSRANSSDYSSASPMSQSSDASGSPNGNGIRNQQSKRLINKSRERARVFFSLQSGAIYELREEDIEEALSQFGDVTNVVVRGNPYRGIIGYVGNFGKILIICKTDLL